MKKGCDFINKKRKLLIIVTMFICAIIFIIIFLIKNAYKNTNYGNNISSKSLKECEEYICNISSYKAKLEVIVNSNKNTCKYVIKQELNSDNQIQEVLEPQNIAGLTFEYKNNQLIIKNNKLELSSIYEDYPYIQENILFLTDFIEQYKLIKENNPNNASISKKDNIIVLTIKTENKYKSVEELYINKDTGFPTKLIVEDNSKNTKIYIIYNEIELLK